MTREKTFVQIKAAPNTKWDQKAWEAQLEKWGGTEKVWSCSGEWDWMVKLDMQKTKGWQEVQDQIAWLRSQPWVANTNTWWAEEQ